MRYLLPVAATLLQQLPVALLQLSDLHAALGSYNRHKQEQEHNSQLQLQLLPQHVRGYSHFMKPEEQLVHQQQQQQLVLAMGTSASGQGVDFPAAEFEMVLDDATNAPTFLVYLRGNHTDPAARTASSQDTPQTGQAANEVGTKATAVTTCAGVDAGDAVDPAVGSLVQVLPHRWDLRELLDMTKG